MALTLIAAMALAGCAGPGRACTGSITWSAGSLPPPHSHSWRIEIVGDGTANFVLWPSHTDQVVSYSEAGISVTEGQVRELCSTIRALPARSSAAAGGAHVSWDLDGGSDSDDDPESAKKVADAAREFLGAARFDEATAAYEAWAEAQPSS